MKNIIILTLVILVFLTFFTREPLDNRRPLFSGYVPDDGGKIADYFPIKEGSFWEYEGTRKEQIEGKIQTNEIRKKVKVDNITTDLGVDTISVVSGDKFEKWLVKDNSIDFEPNESQDKFIFMFPLYVGQKWGDEYQLKNRDDGYYVWEVEQNLSQEVLGEEYNDCFRIAYKTLPDTQYKIFCYGIGIVEEGYKHNGTVMEEIYKLIAYQ